MASKLIALESTVTSISSTVYNVVYTVPTSRAAMIRVYFAVQASASGNTQFTLTAGATAGSPNYVGSIVIAQVIIPTSQWYYSCVPLDTLQGGVANLQGGIALLSSTRLTTPSSGNASAVGGFLPIDYILSVGNVISYNLQTNAAQSCIVRIAGAEDDAA